MTARSSLAARTASVAGGTSFYMLGQLVFMTLLARLGDPILIGAYALATAILNPIFYFSRMGMKLAQATENTDGFDFQTYKILRYCLLCAAVGITFVIDLSLHQPGLVRYVLYVVLAAKIVESLCDLKYGLFLQANHHHAIAASLSMRAGASIVLFGIIWVLADAIIAILALPIGWAVVYGLHDLRHARQILKPRATAPVSLSNLRALFILLLPLALAGFFGQLGTAVPRYVIGLGISAEVLGQLAPALMLHVFVGAFADSIAQALLPSVARDLERGRRTETLSRLVKIALGLLPLVLTGIALSYWAGGWLITFVFGEGYALSASYLWVIALSWSFRAYATLFENIILGHRRFKNMLGIHVTGCAIYAVTSLGLWQGFGLTGAIWGIALGSLLYSVLMMMVSRRLIQSGAA
ncbi:lipopolysaccharide biosynthesis protein [Aliiroseovarius crassostreae]|uniref:lipopolysaccharide biosynthesis protein n=1 Tax=Aliiroseovarius crassostreae TaxID=154981 RepID=UPI003C7B8E2E